MRNTEMMSIALRDPTRFRSRTVESERRKERFTRARRKEISRSEECDCIVTGCSKEYGHEGDHEES